MLQVPTPQLPPAAPSAQRHWQWPQAPPPDELAAPHLLLYKRCIQHMEVFIIGYTYVSCVFLPAGLAGSATTGGQRQVDHCWLRRERKHTAAAG